jgi:hypothetical protein
MNPKAAPKMIRAFQFGGAVTRAGCCKRSFVRLGWDMDANPAWIFTVLTSDSRSQAGAGSKHGDIAGESVRCTPTRASPQRRATVMHATNLET